MSTCFSAGVAAALSVVALSIASVVASAQTDKLAPEACRLLSERLQEAEQGGAKALFDRGAEWAKANASPDQIAAVGRYIGLREQLKFRCPVGFDNLVVAAINGDMLVGTPPLPTRPSRDIIAMKQALRSQGAGTQTPGVPLPTRKPAQLRR